MDRLFVYGAGGHGKVVADAAISQGIFGDIRFLDQVKTELDSHLGLDILGPPSCLEELDDLESYCFALGIGANSARAEAFKVLRALSDRKEAFPVISHSQSSVSSFSRLGEGTVVFAGAVVNPDAELGVCCIVSSGAIVEHDCRLGSFVHLSPGAALAGGVSVGDESWIGMGACVREGVSIGARVTVGAGAVVLNDLPNDCTAVGVPARILERE